MHGSCARRRRRKRRARPEAGPALAPEGHEEHEHASVPPGTLGTVRFEITAGAGTEKAFDRAVAFLHSFEYEETDADDLARKLKVWEREYNHRRPLLALTGATCAEARQLEHLQLGIPSYHWQKSEARATLPTFSIRALRCR